MTNVPGSNHRWIREALRDEFPEIDDLFSDAYLESVAGVAGRSLEYATEKSIRGALEWRRSYKVEALRKAFFCEELRQHEDVRCETRAADDVRGRIFVPRDADTVCAGDETEGFVPSQELVEVCSSGAFVVLEQDPMVTWEGDDASLENTNRIPKLRLVVYADISRINWWKSGVAAGLQYHVLVLEEAFERIRREHQNHNHNNSINTFTNNNKAKKLRTTTQTRGIACALRRHDGLADASPTPGVYEGDDPAFAASLPRSDSQNLRGANLPLAPHPLQGPAPFLEASVAKQNRLAGGGPVGVSRSVAVERVVFTCFPKMTMTITSPGSRWSTIR